MSSVLSVFLAVALVVASPQTLPDPWHLLSHRTAWVFLGYLNLTTETWATQQNFEALKPKSSASTTSGTIPAAGSRLRLTARQRLFLVAYHTSGEAHRAQSPANKRITQDDFVDFLEKGAAVEVHEVTREKEIQGLQGIWARVSPAKAPK